MKKLLFALALAGGVMLAPVAAKAESYAYIPNVLFMQTRPVVHYYHSYPVRYYVPQRHVDFWHRPQPVKFKKDFRQCRDNDRHDHHDRGRNGHH